jgi:protein-S-isoprenylcysteine O-methyltransferase Ste14
MTQLQQLTATVAISACWGAVVLIWVIGALYNAVKGPTRDRRPVTSRSIAGRVLALVAIVAVVVVVGLVPAHTWHLLRVESPWVTFVGLAILLASTALTLWARFALGTMWTMDPAVKQGHRLRTDGPYGITRHPIYTGMLGMLVGSILLAGSGRSVLILVVGGVFFGVKIHAEERLMSATFPDEYAHYRRRVPQLIPGLRLGRRNRTEDD